MDIIYKNFNCLDNLKDQRKLFLECFPEQIGKPPVEEKHYQWKFHSFPSIPRSYEFGAFINNELIGYYAAIPYQYKIDENIFTAGMVCDVMTGSKSRGKGVFTKLGIYSTNELKDSGIDFTTGYPIRPEVIPGHIKAGWKIVFELPIYIKFIKSNSLLKKFGLGFLSPFGNFGITVFNTFLWRSRSNNKYIMKDYLPSELDLLEGYDNFIKEWQESISNTLVKNKDFLKWRLSAPRTNYSILVAYSAEKITGICITTRTEMNGIPVIAILDLMVLPEHFNCIKNINYFLIDYAKMAKIEAFSIMLSKYQAKIMGLGKIGFLKSPYKFSLIIKKLNEKLQDKIFFNESRWNLMWIDSDDL